VSGWLTLEQGQPPVTLAEFTLAGGITGRQTFYDISLVDGYNLPMGIVYHPAQNTSDIPPNLVNPACIATAGYLMEPASRTGTYYTNTSFPMPYETAQSNAAMGRWCPFDFLAFPPTKPGDGVFPYPDDDIQRPVFSPCKSACAATGSESDCCAGGYNDPNICKANDYARSAKAMCPDAYSFAYDDQSSTFIIPSGGGWEVVFCPLGRSTNILSTFGEQLQQVASSGQVSERIKAAAMNRTLIESKPGHAGAGRVPVSASLAMMVFVVTGLALA
jgi:hypothetical protein